MPFEEQSTCQTSTPIDDNDVRHSYGGNHTVNVFETLNRLASTNKDVFRKQISTNKRRNILDRWADIREQVRKENIDLRTGTQDDHKLLKDRVGGWALMPEQIQYLKTTPYEYNASAGSVLELLFLQRFWIWLAQFIPQWIAPCTITAIGFLINLVTCSILIHYAPEAKQEVPRWSLLLCAIGVFLYQIADALDGKQCYKVQNTQIEEFYDHACDSVSTILLMYSVGIATQCGQSPPLFLFVLFSALIAFYSTHWLSYITNQMVFGKIDVTEGQWVMITVHFLSAIFGQSIWQTALSAFGYQITLSQLLSLMTLLTFASAILGNAAIILFSVKTPLEKVGVTIARKQCNRYKPTFPVLIVIGLLYVSYNLGYYHLNPMMFIGLFGVTLAKLTMKLVIAHCTQFEMEITDPSLVAPILLVLNNFITTNTPVISADQALLCALICNTIELIRYYTCVSWDLRVALEVYIFSIRYPPEHPKSRRHCTGFYINGLNNKDLLPKSS